MEFDTTPIMSTYLLAFIVGELERVHANTNGGVEVSVYTLPVRTAPRARWWGCHADGAACAHVQGRTASGEFALNMGVKTLDYFTEFFGIEYPLPKCDMVAIPDFSMGGALPPSLLPHPRAHTQLACCAVLQPWRTGAW